MTRVKRVIGSGKELFLFTARGFRDCLKAFMSFASLAFFVSWCLCGLVSVVDGRVARNDYGNSSEEDILPVRIEETPLDGVFVVVPQLFPDERGFFAEVYRQDQFQELGLPGSFVQLNHSGSVKDTIRGLHFQWDPPMGKLMMVTSGRAFLVAVDIRKGSPSLGKWFGLEASSEDHRMLWAPPHFARGFCVLSDFGEIQYLTTGIYNNKGESGILWDDPEIGIHWPVNDPILSDKDRNAQTLTQWLQRPESDSFTYSK